MARMLNGKEQGWSSAVKDVQAGAHDFAADTAAAIDAPASPFSAVGVTSADFSCKKVGSACRAAGEVFGLVLFLICPHERAHSAWAVAV